MTKAEINRPRCDVTHPTYRAECRFALEPSFFGLASKAAKAGWEPKEIAYALMMLAADAFHVAAPLEDPLTPRNQ